MPYTLRKSPYKRYQLGSLGKASEMLVRQYNFPFSYDDHEKRIYGHDDHITMHDSKHAGETIEKYTGSGPGGLEDWFRASSDATIFAFLKEFMKADPQIEWTGFRVSASCNLKVGGAVYYYELFAKDPKNKTEVYTGEEAPNVYAE